MRRFTHTVVLANATALRYAARSKSSTSGEDDFNDFVFFDTPTATGERLPSAETQPQSASGAMPPPPPQDIALEMEADEFEILSDPLAPPTPTPAPPRPPPLHQHKQTTSSTDASPQSLPRRPTRSQADWDRLKKKATTQPTGNSSRMSERMAPPPRNDIMMEPDHVPTQSPTKSWYDYPSSRNAPQLQQLLHHDSLISMGSKEAVAQTVYESLTEGTFEATEQFTRAKGSSGAQTRGQRTESEHLVQRASWTLMRQGEWQAGVGLAMGACRAVSEMPELISRKMLRYCVTNAIHVCASLGLVEEAIHILKISEGPAYHNGFKNIKEFDFCVHRVLSCCAEKGRWEEAVEIVTRYAHHMDARNESIAAARDLSGRHNAASLGFDEESKLELRSIPVGFHFQMLAAARNANNPKVGEAMFDTFRKALRKLEHVNNPSGHNHMAELYTTNGQWESALNVLTNVLDAKDGMKSDHLTQKAILNAITVSKNSSLYELAVKTYKKAAIDDGRRQVSLSASFIAALGATGEWEKALAFATSAGDFATVDPSLNEKMIGRMSPKIVKATLGVAVDNNRPDLLPVAWQLLDQCKPYEEEHLVKKVAPGVPKAFQTNVDTAKALMSSEKYGGRSTMFEKDVDDCYIKLFEAISELKMKQRVPTMQQSVAGVREDEATMSLNTAAQFVAAQYDTSRWHSRTLPKFMEMLNSVGMDKSVVAIYHEACEVDRTNAVLGERIKQAAHGSRNRGRNARLAMEAARRSSESTPLTTMSLLEQAVYASCSTGKWKLSLQCLEQMLNRLHTADDQKGQEEQGDDGVNEDACAVEDTPSTQGKERDALQQKWKRVVLREVVPAVDAVCRRAGYDDWAEDYQLGEDDEESDE